MRISKYLPETLFHVLDEKRLKSFTFLHKREVEIDRTE